MHKIFQNQRGALTISTLVMMSALFLVMVGVAGVKLSIASKIAAEANENYNYLVVMEDLGQQVHRAVSLGKTGACPVGTSSVVVSGVTLCIPGAAATVASFCSNHNAFNYCLNTLSKVVIVAADLGVPPAYAVEPVGAAQQQTNGGALLPRNSMESWAPSIAWASNNEMYNTDCGTYNAADINKYRIGCNYCADPRAECWDLEMCPPSSTAVPTACAAAVRARQRILIYFENDKKS